MKKKKTQTPTTEEWEVWKYNGQYIQGELLKKYKSKDSAIKYAKKHIDFKYIEPSIKNTRKKKEFFLDDENHMPVGMIIKRP